MEKDFGLAMSDVGNSRGNPRSLGTPSEQSRAARGGSAPAEEAQMSGAGLTQTMNRNRSGLSKIMVMIVVEFDELIGYTT